MKDILMCNLRAFLICIVGIKVDKNFNKEINKKNKLFEYEDERIFPDVDLCLQISQSKIVSKKMEISNTYRSGSYYQDEVKKIDIGEVIVSSDLEKELNEEWDEFVSQISEDDNKEHDEFIKEILGGL